MEEGLRKCYGPLHKGTLLPLNLFSSIKAKACLPCKRIYSRNRYALKSEVLRKNARNWKAKNRSYLLQYSRTYNSKIENKLAYSIKRSAWEHFGIRIKKKDIPLWLGCSLFDWMEYLKKNMTPGMGFVNYGYGRRMWQIDHIHPLSKVDKTNLEKIKMALHFANTRPFWALLNGRKGSKVLASSYVATLQTRYRQPSSEYNSATQSLTPDSIQPTVIVSDRVWTAQSAFH